MTNGAGASYCVDQSMYTPAMPAVLPSVAQAEAARRREEEEINAIRLVNLLVTCANAIQAGDYAAASGNLTEAHSALATKVSPAVGIGRVTSHFAAALAKRVFPASPGHSGAAPDVASSAQHAADLYGQFYEAGPYLKFAHFTANQAILEAFEGCDRVHIIDLAIMQGVQWPALIHTLSLRPGGPPALRITGLAADGSRDEVNEVGLRLAEYARSMNVPFSFRAVPGDTLEALQPWMFQIVPGEALAVNSICQLHRLLVDPDAASTTSLPSPIDAVLGWIAAMQPRVFTVVEQEADHNKPTLVERFKNALFYYGAVIDSMEALPAHRRGVRADAYLQREIFDIVCGEGSGRAERHEPLHIWYARLCCAGFAQVPIGPSETRQAATLLLAFVDAGYSVKEVAGCLTLMWHEVPLFTASVWRGAPMSTAAAGIMDDRAEGKKIIGHQQQAAAGGIAMQ
jgi:DELLA protein